MGKKKIAKQSETDVLKDASGQEAAAAKAPVSAGAKN